MIDLFYFIYWFIYFTWFIDLFYFIDFFTLFYFIDFIDLCCLIIDWFYLSDLLIFFVTFFIWFILLNLLCHIRINRCLISHHILDLFSKTQTETVSSQIFGASLVYSLHKSYGFAFFNGREQVMLVWSNTRLSKWLHFLFINEHLL